MKTLALAFGSSLAASIIFYAILASSGLGDNALHIALIPLLGTSHLYELMEKAQAKRNFSMSPKAIFTFKGFAIPWYVMIIYGALIFVGISEGAGWLGTVMANQVTSSGDSWARYATIMKAVSWPLMLLGLYLLGFWIGSRCVAHGVIATISSFFLGATLILLVDFVVAGLTGRMKDFETFHGSLKEIGSSIPHLLVASWRPLGFALLGYWRGSRTRMSKYLQYLLAVLPPDTGMTIVNLAYDEAQTSAAKRVRVDATVQG